MAVKFKTTNLPPKDLLGSLAVAPVHKPVPGELPSKLAEAGKLYQPVKGTSAGSVYATVALSETMKVAARVGSDKLSIRVEGLCITDPKVVKKLIEIGFTESKGTHFSMHLSCGNVPVERVIGAILGSLGREFKTPIPVLDRVKEISK